MRPARSRSASAFLALGTACALLLTSACAARFPRSAGAQAVDQAMGTDSGGGTTGQVRSGSASSAGGLTPAQRAAGGTTGGAGITGTTGGAASSGATGTPGPRGTADQGPTSPAEVPAGSTTGVTSTTIKIGIFVPKTGAAPVPPTIDAQAQNYWDYVASKGGISGRNVTVTIYDTQSTEAGARSAVQQAVSDGIFAAVSLDRSSVEGALVTALHNAGIPHLIVQMPDGQPIPSDGFYIGTDQINSGRQVADYMAHTLHLQRVGVVGETDPTAYSARQAFVDEAKADGMQVVHNDAVDGMSNQYLAEAQKLAADNAQAVWLFVAPNNAINIPKEAQADGYHPIWMSSSIDWGFNLVLTPASGALDGAYAFSPWGGLSDPRYNTFNQIDTAGKTTQDKDIGLMAWGVGQLMATALKAAGPHLGRNSFRVAMQNLKTGSVDPITGAPMCWPPVDFTGNKRYGSGDRTIVMKVQGSGATGNSVWATLSGYRSVY